MNLNGTLKIFKELGRPEQAQQLLDFYMANRHEKAAFFDLNAHPFGSDITEPELRAAFAGRRASAPKNQDLAQTLSRIGKNQGRDEEDLEFLASASVSDNVELFKRLRGSELKSAIYTALQFGKFSNSSEPMKRIVATASEALRQIAREIYHQCAPRADVRGHRGEKPPNVRGHLPFSRANLTHDNVLCHC